MGRRKIEIKAIKDDRNRSVTFLKRKGGLFKKAHELSVLCSVDVAVIIFGHNKKLYEFSSSNISDILSRHSYYEAAHEHKGPADFQGKKDTADDDDDDGDMGSPRPESHSSNDQMPRQLHGLPSLTNRHTASASPPIHSKNLIGAQAPSYMAARATPQPMSRPSSRNQRRNSSNLVPPHAYPVSQPPPQQPNGYQYMTNPQVYNPPGPPVMPMQQPSSMNPMPSYPYPSQAQSQPPTQAQAQAQAYISDTSRRQSMPPAFPSERPAPPTETSPPRPEEALIEKRAPAKSRSIYTPIGPSESLLAQHFGFTQEPTRSHSVDVGALSRKNPTSLSNGQNSDKHEGRREPSPKAAPAPPPESMSSHSRTNSLVLDTVGGQPARRPRLKVTIPNEKQSDDSATAGSSAHESGGTAGNQSAKGIETNHNVRGVLPPPSPSVSALLSAGTSGPVNPFARPLPTSTAAPNDQTPVSALPSRFVDSILPSPSNLYPDWMGFGSSLRGGNGSDNMLPSPMNFQTPVIPTSHNMFKEDPDGNGKRKSPGSDQSESSAPKRVKA
ncbi:resistance to lethality of mkk1p386 overexpression [Rhizina undulata]